MSNKKGNEIRLINNRNIQKLKILLEKNDNDFFMAFRFNDFKGVEIIDLLKSQIEKIYMSYSENFTFDFYIDDFLLFSDKKNEKMNEIFNLFVKQYEKKQKKIK